MRLRNEEDTRRAIADDLRKLAEQIERGDFNRVDYDYSPVWEAELDKDGIPTGKRKKIGAHLRVYTDETGRRTG